LIRQSSIVIRHRHSDFHYRKTGITVQIPNSRPLFI